MKLSVCVLSYNDEERIADFINSVNGVDDIVISLDEYSSDNTRSIAESMGARVISRSDFWVTPTENDIKRFKQRFEFSPAFTTDHKFCKSGEVRNEAMSYCKNDWVFFPDSDEIVTWDLPVINKLLPHYDQLYCHYIASRDENGADIFGFDTVKLFKRSMHKWVGRVHETPVPLSKVKTTGVPSMIINHYHTHRIVPPNLESRKQAAMEFAVINDYDARTMNYLAREYYYNKQYRSAIKLYTTYLKNAWWEPEIVESYIRLSLCHWNLQEGDKSREYCMEAIKRNPQNTEALYLASIFFNEPWSSKWRRLALRSDNEDVLFKFSYKLASNLYGPA